MFNSLSIQFTKGVSCLAVEEAVDQRAAPPLSLSRALRQDVLREASGVGSAQPILIRLGESPLGKLLMDRTWKMESLIQEAVG